MSGGRMVWRARDAGFFLREWIVTLGEEFGPAGVVVIEWLEDQAKLQNDGGRVKTGLRSVARGSFVNDVVTVGHVVSRAVSLGLLIDYEERDGRFECVISWWKADQGKAMAANRKARQRAEGPVGPDDPSPLSRSVTLGHAESRPVPKCPPTGQDRTEEPPAKAGGNARKRAIRKQVDQSQAPVSLPDELHHAAHLALTILRSVWEVRGGLEPTLRGVGLAIAAFPDRDHIEVARSVEHWLVSGNGRQVDSDDIVARYRRFLKTTAPRTASNVVRMPGRQTASAHSDRFLRHYEDGAS